MKSTFPNQYNCKVIKCILTCANEYAQEEYIPANLSLYMTARSLAMIGKTKVELLTPKNIVARNIAPIIEERSCSSFLHS